MRPYNLIFILLNFLVGQTGNAQSYEQYAKNIVAELADSSMFGRGYTHGGIDIARDFIKNEFESSGMLKFGDSYFQEFSHSVNSFPNEQTVKLNGKALNAGLDYLIQPYSKGINGEFSLISDTSIKKHNKYEALLLTAEETRKYRKELTKSGKLVVSTSADLTWSASQEELGFTHIILKEELLSDNEANKFTVNVSNKLIKQFNSSNIVGYVIGKQRPDSFIVFSAHYDHLGTMGNAYFNGANDNASGIALLLSLAQYYKQNPPNYSVVFIAFAGEELGLIGSKYFVDHPTIPMYHPVNKVRFMINLDIVGTGLEGVKVVNGSVHQKEFELLQRINSEKELLKTIAIRGPAKNSDHYYFSEKGVPAFFIYTMGGIDAYHDVYDCFETLPLDHIDELVTLLTEFGKQVTNIPHE